MTIRPPAFPDTSTCPVAIVRAQRARRGVALVSMLVIVVMLTLLTLALTRVSHGDFRRARDARVALEAREAADMAAAIVQRDWATLGADSLSVGGVLPPIGWSGAQARGDARTIRTSPTTFWTVSQGQSGDSSSRTLARAAANVAWRLAVPDVEATAALTVRDSLSLLGGAQVSGSDTTLAEWGACPLRLGSGVVGAAGVAMPDTLRLCDGGCGALRTGGRVTGAPVLDQDGSAALPTRYDHFGAEDWVSLTRHATIVLPPGSVVTPAPVVVSGQCDRSAATNWGDPTAATGACATYAPIIWVRGDVEVRGGRGQGILLADGDVTLSAGASFAGIVIAQDDLRSAGAGGTILGAALAGDRSAGSGDHSTLDGATRVQRSTCAVSRALLHSARLIRVRGRAWASLR